MSLFLPRLVAALAAFGCVLAIASTPSAPDFSRSPTLQRIAASGTIRVGYIPTPGTFAFQNEKGDTVGYSIDICQRVFDNVRKTLGRPDLKVSFRPLRAAERIPLLKAGEIDIECGGNTNTAARQQHVDFSHTFFVTGVRLLAHKSFHAERNADLWKRRIAVSKGTTAEALINQLKDEQKLEIVQVNSDPEGVALVEERKADAFAQDDVLLYGLLASSKKRAELAVTGKFMSVEPYGLMLPKDDEPLRRIVDDTTSALMSTGELGRIYRKWFDTDDLRIPMSVYMKENLRFPNKYGIQ
jgi:glutamate/aspartate transport system substrate-binding protein